MIRAPQAEKGSTHFPANADRPINSELSARLHESLQA
jgi:hypothetical protein